MKRLIIVANHQSLRAYRLRSSFEEDQLRFELSEIDFPTGVVARWKNLDPERRLESMARHLNRLIASEAPDSWMMAAPLETQARLLPTLEPRVKARLDGTRTDDLIARPPSRIVHLFAPSPVS